MLGILTGLTHDQRKMVVVELSAAENRVAAVEIVEGCLPVCDPAARIARASALSKMAMPTDCSTTNASNVARRGRYVDLQPDMPF